MSTPVCPYCQEPAVYTSSSAGVYGTDFGAIWICVGCAAWVGVHRGTRRALGRLANAELRSWKRRAHLAFDPLWLNAREAYTDLRSTDRRTVQVLARSRAYLWLGDRLGLTSDQCHIGLFDVEPCRQLCTLIETEQPTAASIRAWATAHGSEELKS